MTARHALAGLLVLPALALAAPAHQHGVGRLDIVRDGPALVIELELPQDAVVGHERTPRTTAEQRAAAQALATLKNGAALVVPDPAAGCQAVNTAVAAPVLEGRGPAVDGHADVTLSLEFRCAEPARLKQLTLRLFDAFARLERLQVQVVGPQGQQQRVLRRPAATVSLP